MYFHKYNSEFWEDKYNSLVDEKWIPVTERLPDVEKTILGTTFSVDVWGFDGWNFRRAYYNYTAKVWLNGNDEQEWPEITHWMPMSKDGLPGYIRYYFADGNLKYDSGNANNSQVIANNTVEEGN